NNPPWPADSPASASSNEGGSTCPILVEKTGELLSKLGGERGKLALIVKVCGISLSVIALNGANCSLKSQSPFNLIMQGVDAKGDFLSPNAQLLAYK
ncbi:MAG TPA: hypothetical protein D7H84_02130, partial [Candidatus Poseidoniales archaeon]